MVPSVDSKVPDKLSPTIVLVCEPYRGFPDPSVIHMLSQQLSISPPNVTETYCPVGAEKE